MSSAVHEWEVYLLWLEFGQRSVGAVDLLIESARVAEIVTSAVASPERSWRRSAVDALATFCRKLTHTVCTTTDNIDIHQLYSMYVCRAVGTGPADPAAAGPIIWQAIRIFMFTLYQFSRTCVDSSRIYAIRRQILMLKCTKFDFRCGFTPDPLAGFKAPTSKGRETKMEGRIRMESGGKNEGPTTCLLYTSPSPRD